MNTTTEMVSPVLPLRTKVGYSIGNLASQIMGAGTGFYLLLFYTDIVGLSGAWIGPALAVGRLWDAVTDPIMGHISDRTRSSFGRRRPYIIFGSPLFALAFVLMWFAPSGQPQHVAFGYVLLTQLFFTTMLTVVGIPYAALGAELTMDYHERNSVMAYQQGTAMIGTIIGACLINLASVAGEWLNDGSAIGGVKDVITAFRMATGYKHLGGAGFRISGLMLAPVVVICYLVSAFTTPENPEFQRRASTPAFRSMLTTLKNGPFRTYIWAFLIHATVGQVGVFMLPYLVIHWVRRPDYMLPGYLLLTLGSLIGLPFWRALGDRLEKKHCYMVGLGVGTVVSLSFLALVSRRWPEGMFVWATMSGLTSGCLRMYPPSMMADIIDLDEFECGLRREGAFIGVNNFIQKCAMSLGALWVGPGLVLVGYNAQAPSQSDRTVLMMRLMYALPLALNILVMLVVSRFPLTSRVMGDVRRTIDARNATASASRASKGGEGHAQQERVYPD